MLGIFSDKNKDKHAQKNSYIYSNHIHKSHTNRHTDTLIPKQTHNHLTSCQKNEYAIKINRAPTQWYH